MRSRAFLWLLLGVLAVAGASWVADHYAAAAADRAQRERLRGQTALLAEWVAALGDGIDPQATATRAAQVLLTRVTLIGAAGVVVGDSSQTASGLAQMDNHGERPEVVAARTGVTGDSRRRSGTTNVVYIYSARRMEGGGPVAYVRIAERAPTAAAFRSSQIALIAGTAALGASLLFYGYARHRRVTLAADRIAQALETDAAAAIEESTDTPEILRLSRSIRRAAALQEERWREAENVRGILTTAVEGMSEGLLFVDSARRIRLANRAARRLFDEDHDPVGGTLSQTVRHPALLDAVESALSGETERTVNLSYETTDRAFEMRVTPLADPDDPELRGALVLLLDVTQLRTLERVRQGFIADVSHELRTPLTAIKAAVETLLDDERFRDEPFPQMISRNADAIEGLVEDLTDLSLIESGAVTLDRSRFDLARLARQTVEQLRPVAGSTPIEVDFDDGLWVDGDERRLRRVLVNLLDNAIKFIRPGGTIRIRGDRDTRSLRLHVRDEGIGIPAAELDRIFHRFHQVASDRSRQRDGHGLGLAIVKHLVRLHEGAITVRSEVGVGSTFTLELPAADGPGEA